MSSDVELVFVSDTNDAIYDFLSPAVMLNVLAPATESDPVEQTGNRFGTPTGDELDLRVIAADLGASGASFDAISGTLEGAVQAEIRETADQPALDFGAQAAVSETQAGAGVQELAGASLIAGEVALAVVDEPSSLLMFGFGLTALVFVMKRQSVKR